MYKNLKVGNVKKLKECELPGLGRINIICGKNNSGKSTLLEAIMGQGDHYLGRCLDRRDIEHVWQSTLETTGWSGSDNILNSDYLTLLSNFIPINKITYCDMLDSIVNEIGERVRRSDDIQRYSINLPQIHMCLDRLIKEPNESVLVPAKRQMQLKFQISNVNKVSSVDPTGKGLLHYLFYEKNQITSSDEYEAYNKIINAFREISGGYVFNVVLSEDSKLHLYFSKSQHWIEAADCGLGLQDLLIILYFAIYPKYNIVMIEEPESHLHPDMQRKLLTFLREQTDKQYFLTTHSNVFVNSALVDKVYFTSFDNDEVHVDDATSRAAILNDLGYSVTDNLVSDLVILVEGPTDIPVIKEFLVKMGLYEKYDIKMWPLGGDIMSQVDVSLFKEKYNIIALIDKDPGSSRSTRNKFLQNCRDNGIESIQLKRYAIENYFTIDALRTISGASIPENLTDINPDIKLEDQIGWNVKNSNLKIARAMTLEDIKHTDLYAFLEKVRSMCETGSRL